MARNVSVYFAATVLLSSCSSLYLHRDQTVDSAMSEGAYSGQTVPKEQYEELARKYQDLLAQAKVLAKNEPAPVAPSVENKPTPVDPLAQKKPELAESTTLDPSELVNKIDTSIPDAVSEAPNSMAAEITPGPAVPTSMGVQTVNNTDEIDDQIVRLRDAMALINANKFENALIILKELETSKEKQIVVRSKMMLGDLLFNQGEFDLASQVYEEVITKYAFSGLVLKALGKLIVCSEKLKQPERQAKYYSLLHDFFEAV
jgi:TolA-binding protein